MIRYFKVLSVALFVFGASGCFKDLDTTPIDPDILTAEVVYEDPAAYKQVLAKLYAGLAVSGQQGPAGQADISEIDEGFGQYLRGFWYHQELSTDEALIGWNDQTIKDFHGQTWGASDGFIYAFYSRVFYQIALSNEYLRETADEKLDARGVAGPLRDQIKAYRAEARFLRALSYWHGLDLFRNTPFATEDYVLGSAPPPQTNAADLYAFIESELKAIDADLVAPRTNEYGRADKAAAWMLLAKLYLNAEVYTGQRKYQESLDYCKKILEAGYTLEPTYQNLFLADNHNSQEIIFSINFDGVSTRTWGGMTFIIRAGIGGSMDPTESGVVSGWGGVRTTPEFVGKFPSDLTGVKTGFNDGKTVSYPKVYVPGSHQGFDATQTSNSLASPTSNKIYEGYKYFPDDNTQIYFTQISSNSAPKFGDNGANGSLETGGAAIVIPQKGFYYFRVDLNAKTYTYEKRDLSIVGSATGGVDIPMVWEEETQTMVAAGQLSIGTFKFRANNADVVVYGDADRDSLLTLNGGDITIDQAGGYKILLDLDKPDYTYQVQLTSFDRRGMFYADGQRLEIDDLSLFTDGYAVRKFRNVTSTGVRGKDTDFPDTDFPMFRLADVYLMAAEAVLRGAEGGNKELAVQYFNKVRERAFTGSAGNFNAGNLTLDVILDERGRELYWECHRRTDLIRFGQFTDGTYRWAWKGGVKEGKATESFRNIYPIPSNDMGVNPNLVQNPGY